MLTVSIKPGPAQERPERLVIRTALDGAALRKRKRTRTCSAPVADTIIPLQSQPLATPSDYRANIPKRPCVDQTRERKTSRANSPPAWSGARCARLTREYNRTDTPRTPRGICFAGATCSAALKPKRSQRTGHLAVVAGDSERHSRLDRRA
jgi:hypothetical protein